MKNYIFTFLALTTALNLSAQDDVSSSKWNNHQIVIDGINSEWQKPLNLYESSTGLLFAISNDNKYLYLCFTTSMEMKAKKLMLAGWEIAFLSKEKGKKFEASIAFPAMQYAETENKHDGMAESKRRNKSNFQGLIKVYKEQLTTVTVKGFKIRNGEIPAFDSADIEIKAGHDSTQGIVYEIAIPLTEMYGNEPMQLSEEMVLHVNVKALKDALAGSSNHNQRPGGMNGRSIGNSNGINRETNPSEDMDINEMPAMDRTVVLSKASFKQKFKLVNK